MSTSQGDGDSGAGFRIREAANVRDLGERDKLVRRMRKIRHDAELQRNGLELWNLAHPNEPPFDTAFENAVIAWCDGKGPMPSVPR